MGVFKLISDCACIDDKNPNPRNYIIKKTEYINGFTIMLIKYTDCTNYDGDKILVYKDTLNNIIHNKYIDPHFCENHISPIARFVPTESGWNMALNFVKNIEL